MVAGVPKNNISVTLRVWRQAGPGKPGGFIDYAAKNLNPHMSILELLDVVNDDLTLKGEEPIAFAHDCREGICGTCSLMIDGKPHGPNQGIASCQTYMRSFDDGAVQVFKSNHVKTDFVMLTLYGLMRQTLERLEEMIEETPALRQAFEKTNEWRKEETC